jgi:hypothetical protein
MLKSELAFSVVSANQPVQVEKLKTEKLKS